MSITDYDWLSLAYLIGAACIVYRFDRWLIARAERKLTERDR